MNCTCPTCRGLGYQLRAGHSDWPGLCPMCGGKRYLKRERIEELLRVSARALDQIDDPRYWRGDPVSFETCVRVLDRIAAVFPESLR